MLATEHTLLRMFLNIWRKILFPGGLHKTAIYNFCIIRCGTFNCSHVLQLPARLSLIFFNSEIFLIFEFWL